LPAEIPETGTNQTIPLGSSTALDDQHCACPPTGPWAKQFTTALDTLRTLQAATG
jgi:hypothetical protein